MSKKFNIHEWQAKRRQQFLTEEVALDDYRLEPEDLDNPDEDLVIIGSGYLDIKSNFKERPPQTNGEYAELGQKVVDKLHNGDKEAALDYIMSKINEQDNRFSGEDEAGMAPRTDEKSLSDGDKRALQVVVGEYSTDEILTYLAVLYDQIGFYDKADMIKKLADQIQDFDSSTGINLNPTDMDENTTGTGASFNAGSGEGYMTPNAFKKKNKED